MKNGLYMRYLKRAFDLLLAVLIMLFIWPLLLLIFMLLLFSIGKPVLFKQKRPGYKGQPFVIYKFRTMTNEKNSSGELLPDENRITWVGQILRSLSLDELPEIFNVIKGDMSIVGPRPLLMQYIGRYSPEQARRHDVFPGITGWAQINGRNDISWEEKFKLDVWYVDNLSFKMDVRIILLTFWRVICREGINREGYATAPEFMGSQPETERQTVNNNEGEKK
jgi:sugar transferase EpsL